jgi:glycosyltransferase involved in cell wall biosynthesis
VIPLLIDLEPEWRGGQNQFLLLLKGLYERGHAAELLTVKGSSLGHRAEKAGICVHYTSRGEFRLPAAMRVGALMRDGRVDIVHVNESHALTAAWLSRAHRRVPVVISRRVGYPLGKSAISRARFKAAARIVANSQWVADKAIASGAAAEKVVVIYEGVEIPRPVSPEARREARARWEVPADQQLLGCAGVLLEDKGQEWVIRALALLKQQFPACGLLIAGEGPYRPQLEALVTELNLTGSVTFAGFVKDIHSVYRALDVFVFPSLFEGLGTSLLSAMAHAVPCVTYFGCALGEIVDNGKYGLQVEPRNPEALAASIGQILGNQMLRASLAAAGRARAENLFSADRMVDETIRLYRTLTA